MCTRVVYQGTNATILTGRSMDWKEECRSNLWIFPRGMDRSGEAGNNPVTVEVEIRQRDRFGLRHMQHGRHE